MSGNSFFLLMRFTLIMMKVPKDYSINIFSHAYIYEHVLGEAKDILNFVNALENK